MSLRKSRGHLSVILLGSMTPKLWNAFLGIIISKDLYSGLYCDYLAFSKSNDNLTYVERCFYYIMLQWELKITAKMTGQTSDVGSHVDKQSFE